MSQRPPRFFVDGVFELGSRLDLTGGDARRLRVVLRARAGDPVEVVDSSATAYSGTIETVGERVTVVLGAGTIAASPALDLVLAQALPKGNKMDFVVEKATELGVSRIVPLVTERTLGGGDRLGKVSRWRRLAEAAAQQCGRATIPAVDAPVEWATFVPDALERGILIVPWELATPEPLNAVLPQVLSRAHALTIAIGPEGGLSYDEVETARAAGATVVSLGNRILRTETAGLVTISAVRYAAGEL